MKDTAMVIEGIVEHGDQRGRLLGFPTANIPLDKEDIEDGVWGAIVRIEPDRWVPAAVSIGRRRTFYANEGQRLLEAHLLDVNEDLYGQRIRVELATKIRAQRAFDNVQSLTKQLNQDVQEVHEWSLSHFPHPRPRFAATPGAAATEALSCPS